MDINSLYYFTEVAKDLHITKTAQRLFMSQQTLSNHILRLEEFFGTPLLYRKPKLSLTYAGEYVLQYADTILKEQSNIQDILSDISVQKRGRIRLGSSPLRTNVVTAILPEFTELYPNVLVEIVFGGSDELNKKVLKGEADLAIVSRISPDPELESSHLLSDQLYLCVPDSLLRKFYGDEADEIRTRSMHGAHIRDFDRLPFCLFNNAMGDLIQKCLVDEKTSLRPILVTSTTAMAFETGLTGVAAFFSSRESLASRYHSIPESMNVFPLRYHDDPVYHEVSLVRHSQRYLNTYTGRFLELMNRYFEDLEKRRFTRAASEN